MLFKISRYVCERRRVSIAPLTSVPALVITYGFCQGDSPVSKTKLRRVPNRGLPGLLECSIQAFGAAAVAAMLRRLQPRSVLLRFVEAKVAVLADSGLLRPSAPLRNRPEHAVRAPRAEQ